MNLNSLLYSLRKISKYLCYSLLIIAFIIVCLLLTTTKSFANSDITTYMPSGDYEGKFHFQVGWSISDNSMNVTGSVEGHSILFTYPVGRETNDYVYIPWVSQNYSTTYYYYAVIPKTATYYGYTTWGYNPEYTNQNSNINLISTEAFTVFRSTNGGAWAQLSTVSANSVYTVNNTSTFPLCDFYNDSNKTLLLYSYETETVLDPIIFVNYEQDLEHDPISLITGEFTYFHFTVPQEIGDYRAALWFLFFHDITDVQPPELAYDNGMTSVLVDPYYYVTGSEYDYLPIFYIGEDNNGDYMYAIPCVYPFGAYLNHHTYTLYMQWGRGGDDYYDATYTWTTDFTAAGIQQQIDNQNNPSLARKKDYMQYLADGNINNELINFPTNPSINDPTLSFFSTLVNTITGAFLNATKSESISFELLGNTYNINSSDYDIFGEDAALPMQSLGYLLSASWAFAIGYMLYVDMRKRIFYMKEFHWSLMFSDDISINML